MASNIEVSGLAELRKTLLKDLPEALQGKASQAALAKAAQPIVRQAQAMAPSRKPRGFVGPVQPDKMKGNLRRSIYSYRARNSTKTYEARYIGVKSRAWYWMFIEFGRGVVKPKRLKDKTRARRLARGSPTNERATLGNPSVGWFGTEVQAAPARPFLRPAFEMYKERAIEIYRISLAPSIEKVAKQAEARSLRRIRKALTGF